MKLVLLIQTVIMREFSHYYWHSGLGSSIIYFKVSQLGILEI